MAEALVGLGSNVGERQRTLDEAVGLLRQTAGVDDVRASAWHDTQPIGGPAAQAAFLNGAVRLTTSLSPTELLDVLHQVETRLGRTRELRWGPRTIDLD